MIVIARPLLMTCAICAALSFSISACYQHHELDERSLGVDAGIVPYAQSDAAPPNADAQPMASLLGTWKLVGLEINGGPRQDVTWDNQFLFEEGRVHYGCPGQFGAFPYSLTEAAPGGVIRVRSGGSGAIWTIVMLDATQLTLEGDTAAPISERGVLPPVYGRELRHYRRQSECLVPLLDGGQ